MKGSHQVPELIVTFGTPMLGIFVTCEMRLSIACPNLRLHKTNGLQMVSFEKSYDETALLPNGGAQYKNIKSIFVSLKKPKHSLAKIEDVNLVN